MAAKVMNYDAAKSGKPAFELIEEATHLLRSSPAGTWAAYYLGTIPFVLGFLYFWADMSRSPFAAGHVTDAAFGIALLFLWMKCWHALFAQCLLAQAADRRMPSWSARDAGRVLLAQAVIQPSALFIIPIAFILMVPLGWVYAFYQNATALGDPTEREPKKLLRKAWTHASLWPVQNHLLLLVASMFVIAVFLNWCVVCFSLPRVFKTLFGIESVFTRSGLSMLNTTFFAVVGALTYLCTDPIIKAVYVLRCFYGESLQSGEDLLANLKEFKLSAKHFVAALLAAVFLAGGTFAAQQALVPVSSTELDKQINDVIHQSKYAWRLPRAYVEDDAPKGIVARFVGDVVNMLKSAIQTALDWLEELLRRLFIGDRGAGNSPLGWVESSLLLYVLLAAVLGLLAVFLLRTWRRRNPGIVAARAEAIARAPDVADENVGAGALPEDGWLKLARELLDKGEFRLAMRAFYLSSLAHLAQRNLIALATFKSNREYQIELRRRAHSFPELLPVFEDNVSVFERIWYGMHEADSDVVQRFADNIERLTAFKAQLS